VPVARAVDEFEARAEPAATVHRSEVDIFAPCALGGIVNRSTISEIKAAAIAGAANNQLAAPEFGRALRERGILFAPDYVINAGGVIGSAEEVGRIPGRISTTHEDMDAALARIHDRLLEIFARSEAEDLPPEAVARSLAQKLIGRDWGHVADCRVPNVSG
jgi:leucine dehydrogenase